MTNSIDIFKNEVAKYAKLSEQEWKLVSKNISFRFLNKNELLISEGEIFNKMWFITKGSRLPNENPGGGADNYWNGVFGVIYFFENGFYLMGEYYYNEKVKADYADYDINTYGKDQIFF